MTAAASPHGLAFAAMKLRFQPYTLEMQHAFTIATSTRTTTPAMLIAVEENGVTGYGEASMPPYLGETQNTAAAFFEKARNVLAAVGDPCRLEAILTSVDAIAPGHTAAKAAIDIALHDWMGRMLGAPWHRIWGLDTARIPVTSFTIGMDTPEVVREKTRAASSYRILKVKLGRDVATDRALIDVIRDVTDQPITVDANQGWINREEALRMTEWLATRNVLFVEQPLPKGQVDDTAWLHERSPLSLIADENVQRLSDVEKAVGVFDGINIKLMKCTGLREAHRMITVARALGLKVMLGCMTETSCAISAAAQLSPLVDWADLDGALLIKNDPFRGATLVEGKMMPTNAPGIGVETGGSGGDDGAEHDTGGLPVGHPRR